jgi:hypothetical protein
MLTDINISQQIGLSNEDLDRLRNFIIERVSTEVEEKEQPIRIIVRGLPKRSRQHTT